MALRTARRIIQRLAKEGKQGLKSRNARNRWSMTYLAVPVSDLSKEMGQNFIEAQKGR
jgi:hypothetical protein